MTRRSIGFPLTIAIVLTLIAAALAVGWQLLVVSDLRPVARGLTGIHWLLLILGGLFFLLIMVGLVLLCAWLIREMRHNQRQQAFLDAVTHEMRTPIASLGLYLDTLVRHDPQGERREDFLRRMRDDLDRLEQTVDGVLAAARAEGRARPGQWRDVDLRGLLERCVEEVCGRHGLPGDTVRLEVPAPTAVRGDAGELELVFRNLLENAIKYSQDEVEVRVAAATTPDGRVEVEVADRGIGIPRRELRKIFQRFYRTGRDVKRTAGLGLGLFIVRALVRRQGGRVTARSEGQGRGSRFLVTLRAAGTESAVPDETPIEIHAENPSG